MRRAFVTGAAGFIGSALCRELVSKGVEVKALVRKHSNVEAIKDLPLQLIYGDLLDSDLLKAGMSDVDAVFHLAALFREAKHPDAEYRRVNFEGTKLVVDLCMQLNVAHLSYCSTTGVLGDVKNPPVDESAPYAPMDLYQVTKTEAEQYVLEKLKSGELRGSVLRPAMVWGPRDTRLFKLFKGVAHRTLPVIGSGKTWCHWILVEDMARAFYKAATTSASNGQLYIIAGERPVSLEDTMREIAKNFNVTLLPFKVPVLPIQIVGSIVELCCKPFGVEPPIYRRRADFFIKNRCFDVTKSRRELELYPTYSFEDEVAHICKWYIDNGWISLQDDKRTLRD